MDEFVALTRSKLNLKGSNEVSLRPLKFANLHFETVSPSWDPCKSRRKEMLPLILLL